MDEQTVFKVAELLQRRKDCRAKLAANQKHREMYEGKVADCLYDINKVQRQLLELGYTGQ